MKYHIGCGRRDWGKDWIHVDGSDHPHVTSNDVYLKDVRPGSVHEIYASHFIEYFDRVEVVNLLKSWKMALRERGTLRIAVPDFQSISSLYFRKEYELEQFLGLLYGKMPLNDSYIYHKTVYDLKSISRLLSDCGYGYIQKKDNWDIPADDCSYAYLPHMNFLNGTLMSLNIVCESL